MKMKIAILAACVGTFALAQAGPAQTAYTGAAEFKSAVTITDVGSAPTIERIIGVKYAFTRTGTCGAFSKNCKPGDKIGTSQAVRAKSTHKAKGYYWDTWGNDGKSRNSLSDEVRKR